MVYVPYIAIGFVFIVLSDVAQIGRRRYLSRALIIFGYAAIVCSLWKLFSANGVSMHPEFLRILFTLTAGAGTILLVYSTVLEIPLLLWLSRDNDIAPSPGRRVLTTGTYGLVRHPGFLWMLLATISFAALYDTRVVTVAVTAVNILNFLLICVEDIYLFPRIFSNYDEYRREVSFLIPGGVAWCKRF